MNSKDLSKLDKVFLKRLKEYRFGSINHLSMEQTWDIWHPYKFDFYGEWVSGEELIDIYDWIFTQFLLDPYKDLPDYIRGKMEGW